MIQFIAIYFYWFNLLLFISIDSTYYYLFLLVQFITIYFYWFNLLLFIQFITMDFFVVLCIPSISVSSIYDYYGNSCQITNSNVTKKRRNTINFLFLCVFWQLSSKQGEAPRNVNAGFRSRNWVDIGSILNYFSKKYQLNNISTKIIKIFNNVGDFGIEFKWWNTKVAFDRYVYTVDAGCHSNHNKVYIDSLI